MTAEEGFFYPEVLQTILIDEPQNKSEILNITVVQAEVLDSDDLVHANFTWVVTNITRDSIGIKLLFEDPLLISSGDPIKHSVKVSLSDD